MNRLNRYLLLLFCAATLFACQRSNTTTIKGKVCGYEGKGVCLLDCQREQGRTRDTIKLDADGNFNHDMECSQPLEMYIYLKYLGENSTSIPIYVLPGQTLSVEMEGEMRNVNFFGTTMERYIVTPKFTGKSANECLYLNIPYKIFEYKDSNGALLTYKEYSTSVERYQDSLKTLLKSCCKPFRERKMEEVEEMQLSQFFSYGHHLAREKYDFNSDKEFVQTLESIDVNDTANCAGKNSIAESYIDMTLAINPELYAEENSIMRILKYLKEKVSNPIVKKRVSDAVMESCLQFGSTDNLLEIFEIYRELSGKSDIFKENEKIYNGVKNILPGMAAPDFIVEDTKGNQVRFKDIIGNGKVAYIDFWATWCAPCCAEIPHMEKLAQELKGKEQVTLISISLDSDKQKWLKKVNEDKPSWPQYIMSKESEKEFDETYNINGIPRFMLMDKEGKFIDNNTARPSFEGCKELILKYL